MEEKTKNKKGLIIVIIILILIILGLLGFIIYKELLDKNEKDTSITTTTTTSKIVTDEEQYDSTDSYKLTLNGKEQTITYKYKITHPSDEKELSEEEKQTIIEEEMFIYNEIKVDVFINKNKVDKTFIIYDDNKNDLETTKKNLNTLNLDNVKILKGIDNKEYLVILIKESDGWLQRTFRATPMIVNDLSKTIYVFDYVNGGSYWVEDSASKLYSQKDLEDGREYLIESDKIYFLSKPENMDNNTDDGYQYYQENTMTINNNEVIIEKGNIYKGHGAGQE